MITQTLGWISFIAIIIALIGIDLFILLNKNNGIKQTSIKECIVLSLIYMIIGLVFGAFVFYLKGYDSGVKYLTGFTLEKTLTLDNIFLISSVFSIFTIPQIYKSKILSYGIIGIIIFRVLAISFGIELINRFEWLLYIFGAFLILTGIKLIFVANKQEAVTSSILNFLKKILPVTDEMHGGQFFKTINNKLFITPMFLALILIAIFDLICALDSLPTIFSITRDPFIIYTSNIFAILGLGSLYFALEAMRQKFYYVKYSLAVLLIFIGSKIFIVHFMKLKEFPTAISMFIVIFIIAAGIVPSFLRK